MGQSKWNEEKIIQTLHDFPPVEDRQTKEELFEKIEKRIDVKRAKRRKSFRFMPMLAAACVLLIAAIISPAVLKETVFETPSSDMEHSPKGSSDVEKEVPQLNRTPEETAPPPDESEEQAESPSEPPIASEIEPKSYESNNVTYHSGVADLPDDKQVVTVYYTVPGAEAVVPVTYLADAGLPKIEALHQAFQVIKAEELGVFENDFHKNDKVRVTDDPEKNELIVDIEPGSIQGSAGEQMFMDTVNHTAYSLGYSRVSFRTNGEQGYEFGHLGPRDIVEVEAPEKGVSTFISGKGKLLLVDDIKADEVETSIEEIIKSMKQPNVFINGVSENEKTVTVEIMEGSRQDDEMLDIAMIESILLTAGRFGFENVRITGIGATEIGPYDLREPLPVLKAPNVISN